MALMTAAADEFDLLVELLALGTPSLCMLLLHWIPHLGRTSGLFESCERLALAF
jgi:hypothetical protein